MHFSEINNRPNREKKTQQQQNKKKRMRTEYIVVWLWHAIKIFIAQAKTGVERKREHSVVCKNVPGKKKVFSRDQDVACKEVLPFIAHFEDDLQIFDLIEELYPFIRFMDRINDKLLMKSEKKKIEIKEKMRKIKRKCEKSREKC